MESKQSKCYLDRIRAILLGEDFVGKSCLFNYYERGLSLLLSGIGLNTCTKFFQSIKIEIWDYSSSARFYRTPSIYCRNSNIIIFVYDITSKKSFMEISWYFEMVKDLKDAIPKCFLLLGNKCDQEERREVSYKEGKDYADKNGFLFFEVSCVTGFNVFESLYASIYSYYPNIKSDNALLTEKPKNHQKKCNLI